MTGQRQDNSGSMTNRLSIDGEIDDGSAIGGIDDGIHGYFVCVNVCYCMRENVFFVTA